MKTHARDLAPQSSCLRRPTSGVLALPALGRGWSMRAAAILAVLLAALGTPVLAQQGSDTVRSQKGYELGLTYREGDPYLFCTEGQGWKNNPTQCWVPIPPYNGGAAWVYTGICDPPNQYGKDWTDDDTKSLAEYQTVCPARGSAEYGAYDSENASYHDQDPIDR